MKKPLRISVEASIIWWKTQNSR